MKFLLLKDILVIPEQKGSAFSADIKIDRVNGLIAEVGQSLDSKHCEIDNSFKNCYAFPGFIDPHVHFRTPGKSDTEDWLHVSKAAIFAGVTTVLDMPNTSPPTIDLASFQAKSKIIAETSLVNFGLHMGLTPDNLADLLKIDEIKSIKVYMASTTGSLLVEDLASLEKSTDKEALLKKVFLFHAESESIIRKNLEIAGEIKTPWQHSEVRSEESAIEATRQVIDLQKRTGLNFHVSHVSTALEVEMLLESDVSFEVCPHRIFCSTDDYREFGFLLKCNPPLREKATADKLLQLLYDEKIPMIATDHAPHRLEEKQRKAPLPPSGVPSLEIGTHLILNEWAKGLLSDNYTSRILSGASAERFSIENRGLIKPGYFADLSLVKKEEWTMQQTDIQSKCGWSPFVGRNFKAKVKATMVNGVLHQTSAPGEIESDVKIFRV